MKSDSKADYCVLIDSFFLLRKQWSIYFLIPHQMRYHILSLTAASPGCIWQNHNGQLETQNTLRASLGCCHQGADFHFSAWGVFALSMMAHSSIAYTFLKQLLIQLFSSSLEFPNHCNIRGILVTSSKRLSVFFFSLTLCIYFNRKQV